MRVLFSYLLVAVFLFAKGSQGEECNENRIRGLLKTPPKTWATYIITKQDIDDFICSETLVTAIVDCLESADKCGQVEGMGNFVDEIYSRIDEGNNCPSCDPKLMALIRDSVRVVQKRFPKQYIRGLSLF